MNDKDLDNIRNMQAILKNAEKKHLDETGFYTLDGFISVTTRFGAYQDDYQQVSFEVMVRFGDVQHIYGSTKDALDAVVEWNGACVFGRKSPATPLALLHFKSVSDSGGSR